jgi:hypothetical protein
MAGPVPAIDVFGAAKACRMAENDDGFNPKNFKSDCRDPSDICRLGRRYLVLVSGSCLFAQDGWGVWISDGYRHEVGLF